MKNVRWVVLLGLVVAGGLLALVLVSRNGSANDDPAPKQQVRARAARSGEPTQPRRRDLSAPRTTPAARDAEPRSPVGAGGDVMVRDDGTVVRDHRTQSNAAPDLSRSPRRPVSRAKVKPATIISLRRAMRPIVRECAEEFSDDLEEGARLQSELQVSILAGVLSVGRSEAQTERISGDGFTECVTQRVGNIELSVEDHDDVDHHMLTYPFRLPVN